MPEEIVIGGETQVFRLAKAAYSFPTEVDTDGALWSLGKGRSAIDKMVVPTDYHAIVSLCRFFYTHEGLAHSTINKQVEIANNGYKINQGSCTDREFVVYKSLNERISRFLNEASLEYLLSGLVIPEVTWDRIRLSSIEQRRRGSVLLPVDIWVRDPNSLDIKKTPLPNRLVVFVKVSDEDRYFIMNNGKFKDGSQDKETYELLVENYPDFVRAVKNGDTFFKLPDPFVVRRKPRSGNVWPTPYLLPALELFMHKRNLRKMDYSIAARVIQAIQLFRLGNDEYPLTEDDADQITELREQMYWRGLPNNVERVFQLFSNHTLQIDWIMPDTKALLDEGKYRSINEDILVALGLPRLVLVGENLRSGAGTSEVAMLPSSCSIDSMREDLLSFVRHLYKEIQKRNNFKGVPEPYYPPIRLQKLADLLSIGVELHDRGVISKTGLGEIADFDFNVEMERRAKEQKKMKELGLPDFAPVPFSPQPDKQNME